MGTQHPATVLSTPQPCLSHAPPLLLRGGLLCGLPSAEPSLPPSSENRTSGILSLATPRPSYFLSKEPSRIQLWLTPPARSSNVAALAHPPTLTWFAGLWCLVTAPTSVATSAEAYTR